jgi:phage/plasmid-associated DNA primase
MLGNETLTGRQLYGKQENFENKSNIIAASNYEFAINSSDNGIWRRIRYYLFKVKFCDDPNPNNKYEKKINKKLISDVIKKEEIASAFLSILIFYYTKFINDYNSDLKNIESHTITEETMQYRNRQDYLNKFIMSNICVIIEPISTIILTIDEISIKFREWYLFYQGNSKNTINLDEVTAQIENSVLSSFMEFDPISYKKVFKNIRILQTGETPNENEVPIKKFMLDKIKKK